MNWFLVSDAGHWTLLALAALCVVVVALAGDWRRARRKSPDAVGCMPWTSVFMAALLVAVVAGALAVMTWLKP
ncbi:hypothetical protein [Croceicoccus mobilis]|uniref:Uncharacterized protein n=1 Tax=Croceicoccus mobilis TaxID=1703339 RepID=A0A916YYR1_9SPHN|nr:hypothetical protein [Croceicoccus mobilis]GGD67640.1 hypothetical protein GCM10010990_16400 [Croceicoccus mobilis]